jgi:hypothetical protein
MNQIFQDYHDGNITGNEKLRELFAQREDQPISWVQCKDITIKDLVNQICDDFEAAGFDLDNLPIENIRDKFLEYQPKVVVPPKYRLLVEAKETIKSQIESIKSIQHVEEEQIESLLSKFYDSIAEIDRQIKDLL